MAWYNTGTIALTNGSATVTGSGTNFLVGAQIGEALYAPDGKLYEIQTINSATVITLASNYLGSTASGQDYQIIPTQSLVADLASDVTDLISDFADVRDYAGNGKFNDGAVGTPGITFTQDQDNGLYRIGSNNWALAAGGQQVVNLTTTAMNFPDNSKAIFGAGSDLQIFHNATDSYIVDNGTGNLNIKGSNLYLRANNNDAFIYGIEDGPVRIYHDNVEKFITTTTGIDVTGTVTADGLTVQSTATTRPTIGNSDANTSGLTTGLNFEPISNLSNGAKLNVISGLQPTVASAYTAGFEFVTEDHSGGGTFAQTKALTIGASGDISFYEDTGTTPKFFWDASAESLGLGTSSPSSYNSAGNDLVIASTGAGLTIASDPADSGHILFADSTTGTGAYTGFIRYDHTTDSMRFAVNAGVERMRIDASGNVDLSGAGTLIFRNGTLSAPITGAFKDAFLGNVDGVMTYAINGASNSAYGQHAFVVRKGDSSDPIEAMRIDASGLVGIGTSSPSSYQANADNLVVASSGETGITIASGTSNLGNIHFADGTSGDDAYRGYIQYNHTSNYMRFATDATERMRINDSGNVGIGTSSTGGNAALVLSTGSFSLGIKQFCNSGQASNSFEVGGSIVGSITHTASATAYNTSSDQRLKENIADADDAGAKIDSIQVRKYNWKADGSHQDYGMVAQELIEVAPEAVSGDADSEEMMGVDYSKLVPMMLKEIQSLRARIAALES
jgi:hypothetical protein